MSPYIRIQINMCKTNDFLNQNSWNTRGTIVSCKTHWGMLELTDERVRSRLVIVSKSLPQTDSLVRKRTVTLWGGWQAPPWPVIEADTPSNKLPWHHAPAQVPGGLAGQTAHPRGPCPKCRPRGEPREKRSKLRDFVQSQWSVLFKSVKVMTDRQTLELSQMEGDWAGVTTKRWCCSRWDPGPKRRH